MLFPFYFTISDKLIKLLIVAVNNLAKVCGELLRPLLV
jgi:hypothetical protein